MDSAWTAWVRARDAEVKRARLVDEYAIYLAPALLGGDQLAVRDIGAASMPDIRLLDIRSVEQLGNDLFISARPSAAGRQ